MISLISPSRESPENELSYFPQRREDENENTEHRGEKKGHKIDLRKK